MSKEEDTQQIDNNVNYYEIILELKKYLYRVQKAETMEDLDIITTEIKKFYNTDILKDEIQNRINLFRNSRVYRHKNMLVNVINNAVLSEILRKFPKDTSEYNLKISSFFKKKELSIPAFCYYYVLDEIMGNNIQYQDSVANFYFTNVFQYLMTCIQEISEEVDKEKAIKSLNNLNPIFNKIKLLGALLGADAINNVDFVALYSEDYFVYGRAICITNEFYPKWLKSALLGTIYELLAFIKNKSLKQPKLKTFTPNKKYSFENFNNLKQNIQCNLSPEEISILKLRKNLIPNKYKNIGQKMTPTLTESNITQKFTSIKNKLGANSPDEAVAIFEQRYFNLANSQTL